MRVRAKALLLCALTVLAACSGGGDAPKLAASPSSPPPMTAIQNRYTLFESGHVRPMALSPDGARLYVVNTPNNCLEVFATDDALTRVATIPVGLEPVAVAAPTNDEVWVVNHLSDSVSVIDMNGVPRVKQTLWVGDEPRDIVFAGPNRQRAFITSAYRGQNHPTFRASDLRENGHGRADVWVFDRTAPSSAAGGAPLSIINLFSDAPRALAVSNDGATVYAAAFLSGNRTTVIDERAVLDGSTAPTPSRAKPLPDTNSDGVVAPNTGLIVKYDGAAWRDDAGSDWSDKIQFSLPDYDVFEIDAMAETPVEKARIAHVGTTLFNMAVHPVSGTLYVSNLDARNVVRFEGPGTTASTVRGNIAQSRISVIADGEVMPRNLNKHLTHTEAQGESIVAADKARTLSQPMQMALTADGETLYVAAMGSNKIGIFDTQALEQDTFVPDAAERITLPASGPTGVVLNGNGSRLYVTTRFDNSVRAIDTAERNVVATRALFSPEPQSVIDGRRFLYDADLTSANGENACSSCHMFGDVDALAWDLGNPDASLQEKPINEQAPALAPSTAPFHPMKGPMTTQTFRGMKDHGPLHWRGDRTGNTRASVNGVTESREAAAFKAFNGAFVGLVGREQPLSATQMQQFTDFALQIMPPPNPIRPLDNSMTEAQSRGRSIYMTGLTAVVFTCNNCHEVDAQKTRFGSNTTLVSEGGAVSQDFKVPQLRNAYTKVGRFDDGAEQIRGFGFLHDGSVPTLRRFLQASVFTFNSDTERDQVTDFVFAIDSNFAPVVGQQITVTSSNRESAQARLDTLMQRAQAQECDLVASVVLDGASVQAVARSATEFAMAGGASVSRDQLLQRLPVTFTCYPPGNAQRLL